MWSIDFQQRQQGNSVGKGKCLQQMMLERLAICMKNGQLLSHHMQKVMKMDYKSKLQAKLQNF